MLKFLIAAAPYVLKAPSQTSRKQVARSFIALVLLALSVVALIAAAFVYVTSIYGAAAGFVAVSAIFLIIGLPLFFKARNPRRLAKNAPPLIASSDPIAALVPDSVLRDPAVTKLLNQVVANPVATSLAAATIGMMITREIMKD